MWEVQLLDGTVDLLIVLGRWDEATARAAGQRCIAAKASSPVPVPMSARLATRTPCALSRSSAIRQPAVVSCWPVPKARPASISNATQPGAAALR